MKRGSRRNLSIGLLLLVVTLACVVSHKFREGMVGKKDEVEVEERLNEIDDKLDDIYEEVVGEGGGEERIKTGKYVYHKDDGEYNEDLSIVLTKKGGNEYSLRSTFKDEKKNFSINLELFSDNSMLGKDVKTGDMSILLFHKSGKFFFTEKAFFVHVDYKKEFLEDVKKAKGKNDSIIWWDLIDYFDMMKAFKNEASEKKDKERKELKKRERDE